MTSLLAHTLVSLTKHLVSFPSTESRPEARAACMESCREWLSRAPGVVLQSYSSHGFESLVALPDGVKHPEILLTGHLDVVEHRGPDVYQATERDGRLWGPGTGDMKGQCAVLLELFATLHRQFPGLSLGLALTSDEERGGEDGIGYLFNAVGFRCGLVLLPDGGSLNAVTAEEKGILQLRLRIEGREGHAAAPWLFPNPLKKLIRALADVDAFFEGLRDDASADHWYPTCSPTICHTPNLSVNCIPGLAEAVVDVRFPPPYTAQSLMSDMAGVVGDGVTLDIIATAEATRLSPDPLYLEIAAEVTGQPVRLVRASGGSDAVFMARHGVPVVLSSPVVGQLHRVDEWIDIRSMETYYWICEKFICQKLGLGG